jgi:uncharacterized protein YbjT (DUF2867 family)
METTPNRVTVAIAGASGFVGTHLSAALRDDYRVVALTRRAQETPGIEGRACDLFSASSTVAALRGVDVAIYLVHSMMPSTRLFQGNFHDTDLLLADNFARACKSQGVRHIIYLGGLKPEAGFVSPHLSSRHEVETVLASSGVPVTCLRAGMVVGPGGSSFEILRAMVSRLPWMVLPRWTSSVSQAVYISDVVAVLKAAILSPNFLGKTLDLVNGEALTYEDLLRQTAEAMGKKRLMVPVPISSTGFSKRWVQLFSRASYELVSPLIDSLQCDLPRVGPGPEIAPLIQFRNFRAMLEPALRPEPARGARASRTRKTDLPTVRSIQRLPTLRHTNVGSISNEYLNWLPQFFRTVVRVHRETGSRRITFGLAGIPWPLLVLEQVDSEIELERDKFLIVGGLLSKTTSTGWLEFRQVADKRFTLASIHDFVPALPWPIYVVTQAPLHAWVMRRFGDHLSRLPTPTPAEATV